MSDDCNCGEMEWCVRCLPRDDRDSPAPAEIPQAAPVVTDEAVEAAQPHLAPQPTLPICPNCEGEHFTCGACGIVLDATVTPQPMVDREALRQLVTYCRDREVYKGRDNEIGADTAYGDVADRLDAILALLTGSAK